MRRGGQRKSSSRWRSSRMRRAAIGLLLMIGRRMRAIVVKKPGGPEALQIAEVPDPQPREGDLIVRVRAAGVNRADLLQRLGRYPPPPGESDIIGLEVSGGGEHAAGSYRRGDRGVALPAGGGYSGRAPGPAAPAVPIPGRPPFA